MRKKGKTHREYIVLAIYFTIGGVGYGVKQCEAFSGIVSVFLNLFFLWFSQFHGVSFRMIDCTFSF
jgi:hypothetical protein